MACPTEKYNPRDMTLHCKRELCLAIGINLYASPASKKKPFCVMGNKSFPFLPWIRGEHSFSKDFDFVTQEHFKLESTVIVASAEHLIWPLTFVKVQRQGCHFCIQVKMILVWVDLDFRLYHVSWMFHSCCPYGSCATTQKRHLRLKSQTLSLDLRYNAWQGLKVSHLGDVQKS